MLLPVVVAVCWRSLLFITKTKLLEPPATATATAMATWRLCRYFAGDKKVDRQKQQPAAGWADIEEGRRGGVEAAVQLNKPS